MKAILIAVALLFFAHSASVAGERGRGSGVHRGGGNAAHSQPRQSNRDRGINQPRYGDGGGQRSRPYSGPPARGWGYGRGYGGGFWPGRGYGGEFTGGILGGIVGGAIGSIFAPEPEPPVVIVQQPPPSEGPAAWSPEWFAYCTARYKSFEPQTGTFTGYDGIKYFCK